MENHSSQLIDNLFEEGFRNELLESSTMKEVPAGTQLIHEGSYLKVVPIVLSGSLKVFRMEQEKEILLYYINADESCIMSLNAAFTNKKTDFRAVAEEDSKLLLMPARLLSDWQNSYQTFQQFISDLYKKRFEDLLVAFNTVAFNKSDDRLLAYLKSKVHSDQSDRIKITHQVIADELGIARETVSRLLKKLEQDGVVALERGAIKILSM